MRVANGDNNVERVMKCDEVTWMISHNMVGFRNHIPHAHALLLNNTDCMGRTIKFTGGTYWLKSIRHTPSPLSISNRVLPDSISFHLFPLGVIPEDKKNKTTVTCFFIFKGDARD